MWQKSKLVSRGGWPERLSPLLGPSCHRPACRTNPQPPRARELSPTCSYQEGSPRSSGPCVQLTLLWHQSSQGWTIKQERD